MRFISADYIFPISSEPIPNGIIEIDDVGKIMALYTTKDAIAAQLHPHIEYHSGSICPGFINTHCHLELSHLKGVINTGLGLPAFIKAIISKRDTVTDTKGIATAIEAADREMAANGIVAVGDISNTTDTIPQKENSSLIYYNFIELFDLYNTAKTQAIFDQGKQLKQAYGEALKKLPATYTSLVPHAPYSVSPGLFQLLTNNCENEVISIHNQETESEDELFISNSGELLRTLKDMGVSMESFKPTGSSAVRSVLPYYLKCSNILLVHNTYTSATDIAWVNAYHKQNNSDTQVYWATCPNANLYIENRLPDYTGLIANNAKITIGTDSYASNWSLSILDELKTIAANFPAINLQTLLSWATKNGAAALGLTAKLGTIEQGKTPGLNLITTSADLTLTGNSTVKRLL